MSLSRSSAGPTSRRSHGRCARRGRAGGQAGAVSLALVGCLNGEPGDERALRDLRAFAAAHDVEAIVVDADGDTGAPLPDAASLSVVALCTRRAGKAMAWNLLRQRVRSPTILFMDA